MNSHRHGSALGRAAVSVVLAYAIVLQAFIAAAAPLMDQNRATGVICASNGTAPEAPAGRLHSGHGLCCILAFEACAHAYLKVGQAFTAYAPSAFSSFFWIVPGRVGVVPRLSAPFAARGPPENL